MNERGLNPFKKNLSKDHVFLTGAGMGIGKLMALRLGKLGCSLSLADINMKALEETAYWLVEEGIPIENICIIKCDVSRVASIRKAADKARERFGHVTVLINNAGVISGQPLESLTQNHILRTMNVNCLAHLHTVREFYPDMKANRRGHIVTIASVAGLMGCPGMLDYCASKFASIGMEESLRFELNKSGDSRFIKTTCIAPYLINTGMFEGGK